MQLDFWDWFSGIVGIIVTLIGISMILNLKFLDFFKTGLVSKLVPYAILVLGLYLLITSIIELENSNAIGWLSIIVGLAVTLAGGLLALKGLGIGPGLEIGVPILAYHIVFILEGVFLALAMFDMEP